MEFVYPEIANKTRHISHGMMRFQTGKMSSRKGNVITGESLIADVEKMVEEKVKDRDYDAELKKEIVEKVAIGAIKYSILRQSPGKDIIFDFEKSLSFEGDSGPYLQYTYARANSVLEKAKGPGDDSKVDLPNEISVTTIEKLLYRFPEIIERACKEYAPQLIATYLIDIASAFNNFYAENQIIDKENPAVTSHRLRITQAISHVLKNGLEVLGIRAPEKM